MLYVAELQRMYAGLGPRETCRRITEALNEGHLAPSDFSVRDLAEGLVPDGREWVRSLDPRNGTSVMENSAVVNSTAFSNIMGQLLINAVMAAYNSPEFVVSQLFPTIQTRLSGERIPGIGTLSDSAQSVPEGMPIPHVGMVEDYIDTPVTDKKGLIVPVTKEMIFFDRTGLILERAAEVGTTLGLNKEKRCVDVLCGAVNNYKWKGTSYNTYQASTPWSNTVTGSTADLTDWSQIDTAEQKFAEMLDPSTGEPIVILPKHLLVTPAKKYTLNRILNATEVRTVVNNVTNITGNPVSGISPYVSPWLYSRLQSQLSLNAAQSKATWFYGDLAKAFRYMENWPITVVQAPQNSEAEFNNDIVARFKATERGAAAVFDPRYVVRVSGY